MQVIVRLLGWCTGEWVNEGECQVTPHPHPHPPSPIKIFIFKWTHKIINCCSVPLRLVSGVETTAGGGVEKIVSTLFKGA